jgi:methionyl-tRNA formyltransferase
MKVVFMGTPEFAVPSLRALLGSRHEVCCVVTVKDKPAGRGRKLRPSPVKSVAMEATLPILQPESLREVDFVRALAAFEADCFAVVAFRILPDVIFEMPPEGTVNLHSSLLPKYRGAAPINWAIMNGDSETGVTTFLIEKGVDTGMLLRQRSVAIGPDETAGEVHDKLALLGANLLLQTIDDIAAGNVSPKPQMGDVTVAPKITPEVCRIDWSREPEQIRNQVRGLTPHPGAYSFLHKKRIKILGTKVTGISSGRPGEILHADTKKGELVVSAGSGSLTILCLQPEGKRPMSAKDFMIGQRIDMGEMFEDA